MGESIKQVKINNWSIFVLQRLQIFLNKTDYCDLTLQFEGNLQLKVHRLVINTCTNFFNVLEQTCEVINGNILIMPRNLQADVIVPIVNFMYTGLLEFQMSVFDRLYNTVELMNIPILKNLLDAQRQPIVPMPKPASKKQQPVVNLNGKKVTPKATLLDRKLPIRKRKSASAPTEHSMVPYYHHGAKRVPQNLSGTFDNTPKHLGENKLIASTSFKEVRHSPSSHKIFMGLANPSIGLEEAENYIKEQTTRSYLVKHKDSERITPEKPESGAKRKSEKAASPIFKSVCSSSNKETKIHVSPSEIVAEKNHVEIISDVLRKYPYLMKKNKSIHLKILTKLPAKTGTETQKVRRALPKTTPLKLRVEFSNPKGTPLDVKLNK